jgi:hypothetical protein
MQAAHNNGDVEKELSFFDDDVRCEFGESIALEGKEQLRNAVRQNALLNSRMTFSDCKERGNIVTCKVKEQNDMLRAAGIGPAYYEFSQQIFEKGLIKEVRTKPSEESRRAWNEFWASFVTWVTDKRAQEWAGLGTEGVTKENRNRLLALVREWRKETQQDK